jgi:hypothetical protein
MFNVDLPVPFVCLGKCCCYDIDMHSSLHMLYLADVLLQSLCNEHIYEYCVNLQTASNLMLLAIKCVCCHLAMRVYIFLTEHLYCSVYIDIFVKQYVWKLQV